MKIAKGVLALVGGVAVSSAALAQQQAAVSGEKKAPLQNLVPDSYGKLELRHTTNEKIDAETGDQSISPNLQIRPTLGSTFFDGKVDSAFTWIFWKQADDVRITKAALYNETTWTVFENDNFKFMPYLYVEKYAAEGNTFDLAQIGPHIDVMTSLPLAAGKLTLSAFVEPLAEFYSDPSQPKSTLKNDTGKSSSDLALALATPAPEKEEAGVDINQKDPTLYNTTEVAVKFSPAALSALSVGVAANYLQGWTPKYRAVEKNGETTVEDDGYRTDSMIINKLTVSYKINDTFTVLNQARYGIDGFYAATQNPGDNDRFAIGNRFENRLVLNATLF